jgi:hypothetical protein
MTTLNTKEFLDSYNELNGAKFPNSHDKRLAYVALATMLELCINWKYGIVQTQKTLDEKSNEWKNELEKLGA